MADAPRFGLIEEYLALQASSHSSKAWYVGSVVWLESEITKAALGKRIDFMIAKRPRLGCEVVRCGKQGSHKFVDLTKSVRGFDMVTHVVLEVNASAKDEVTSDGRTVAGEGSGPSEVAAVSGFIEDVMSLPFAAGLPSWQCFLLKLKPNGEAKRREESSTISSSGHFTTAEGNCRGEHSEAEGGVIVIRCHHAYGDGTFLMQCFQCLSDCGGEPEEEKSHDNSTRGKGAQEGQRVNSTQNAQWASTEVAGQSFENLRHCISNSRDYKSYLNWRCMTYFFRVFVFYLSNIFCDMYWKMKKISQLFSANVCFLAATCCNLPFAIPFFVSQFWEFYISVFALPDDFTLLTPIGTYTGKVRLRFLPALPLEALKHAARPHSATVNDMVMAAGTGAAHRYLQNYDATFAGRSSRKARFSDTMSSLAESVVPSYIFRGLRYMKDVVPTATSLLEVPRMRMWIMRSLRSPESATHPFVEPFDVGATAVYIPVTQTDRLRRMQIITQRTKLVRSFSLFLFMKGQTLLGLRLLKHVLNCTAGWWFVKFFLNLIHNEHYGRLRSCLALSNLRGPTEKIKILGVEVKRMQAFVNHGQMLTVFSYAGQVEIAFATESYVVDADVIQKFMIEEFDALMNGKMHDQKIRQLE